MSPSIDAVGALSPDYFLPVATDPGQASKGMDKDAFLKLLVASLKYQDPSEPMSNSELMAQTTQLATMEQLTTMTELTQESFILQIQTVAMNLMGRTVEYYDGQDMQTGSVTAVDFSAAPPLIEIDGDITTTFGSVRAVVAEPATPSPLP